MFVGMLLRMPLSKAKAAFFCKSLSEIWKDRKGLRRLRWIAIPAPLAFSTIRTPVVDFVIQQFSNFYLAWHTASLLPISDVLFVVGS
jgi:hypothetical protein